MRGQFSKLFIIFGIFLFLGIPCLEGRTHEVASSETFYSISQKYGVSVSDLMSANGIDDPRKLRLGQKLVIPEKGGSAVKVATRVEEKPRAKVVPTTRKKLRVVVDAGHGGKDRGALWGGVSESTLTLKVALLVESNLKARGYEVTMTRRSDQFTSLLKRAELANRYGNAVFVSIHFNATEDRRVRGVETFYASDRGKYLAAGIQDQLAKTLKLRNRGIHFRRYAVLRYTNCPAVLVECGFLSNESERARCVTASYQAGVARAIVAGIERYDRAY